MKRILIINPFGIGDVLFTTPLVKSLKRSMPDCFIAYWCNERVEAVLKSNPYINKIIALSRGDLKKIAKKSKLKGLSRFFCLLGTLKKQNFDTCFDLSLDHRYSLIVKLLGVKKRVGLNYKNRGRLLTDKINVSGYDTKHVIEYYLDLLRMVNIEPYDNNMDLLISINDKKRALERLTNLGIKKEDILIGISCAGGESWGENAEYKHWPAVRFAELADKIIDIFKAKIIILGDSQEQNIARQLIDAMRNKPIDLSGKTDINELCAIIENLNLLITNDGGPLHIAVALKRKTVSFFGPVDPRVYGPNPIGINNIVMYKGLDCSPCYRNFRLEGCLRNKECLEKINVEEAFKAVSKLLSKEN